MRQKMKEEDFSLCIPDKAYIKQLEQQNEVLRNEIELFTAYSSDTLYRLRYDSMTYDYVSPAIVRLLGFTPDEMKKLDVRKFILETRLISDGFHTVSSYEELETVRKRGDVNKWQADYLMTRKDGRSIWVSDISYPWLDKNHRVIGSVGTLRDINDRVQAENCLQEEKMYQMYHDLLTGMANRRAFFEKVEEEIKRIKNSRSDFTVLLLNVDHFKSINDSYGHHTGDKVLIELAGIINSCLRETDMAARTGGEEFAIFLPDTNEKAGLWVAEHIRSKIAKHFFILDSRKTPPLSLTVSIGVASATPYEEVTSASLYKIADMRLYIAKHTGRNQVSVDEIASVH